MPIEKHAPGLDRIVDVNQQIEELASGFGGDAGPAEGPVWWHDGGYLIFSDIGNNRRMKWSPSDGCTLFYEPTNEANGLTRDRQGRLIACEHLARRVTRWEHDGSLTVVANNYKSRRLNRPNDVVVKSDGSIYFTDPGLGRIESELDFCGVYRVSPDLGAIHVLVWDFVVPNGLAFSPDERILYVNDSRRGHIRAFDVEESGLLAMATDRVFATLQDDRIGVPDGMKVDVEGNVYCTGPGGIWIFDRDGIHLGMVATGAQTTNVAWGDDDWQTLYFTTWST
ncbi:MAG: SMP-30/gluconolactonase/LRE family protein, partial [Candidatus Tectomicrobia bacterium]|nr:SMP-30/gluconolactonase/LRE family protein [Candidatus Tectomicrobia bacterium]